MASTRTTSLIAAMASVAAGLAAGRRRLVWFTTIAALAGLWSTAQASAADYYVDQDVLDPFNTCTLTTPCNQISEAITLADADDGSADMVRVGRSATPYGAVTVPNTPVTLLGGEFNAGADGPATEIDGAAAAGVSFANGTAARTLRGFTIKGGDSAAIVSSVQNAGGAGGITIDGNLFNEPSSELDAFISLQGSHSITGNVIEGSGQFVGIQSLSSISARISGNEIQGTERAIDLEGLGMTGTQNIVEGNTIEVLGTVLSPAAGIFLLAATGDVRDNLITMHPTTTLSQTNGIYAANNDTSGTLRLSRNTILGFDVPSGRAIDIVTPDPVTMNSDLLVGNTFGIVDSGNGNSTSLTVTNATIWENTSADIRLTNNPTEVAVVDSSILGDIGIQDQAGGSTCTSSFSRGPSGVPFCGPYATNAIPSFVEAGAGNYHLAEGGNSSLIDMGNPATPTGTDFDGDPRAVDATLDCVAAPRRDIGADELIPSPPASPLNCSVPSAPGATNPKKKRKCKKKHKRRSAESAKKKRCKKKRKRG
jgi:hypothetical protein